MLAITIATTTIVKAIIIPLELTIMIIKIKKGMDLFFITYFQRVHIE